MKARSRTISRLIRRYKISIHIPKKVRLRIQYRPIGIHCEFGYKYKEHLEKASKLWTKEGLPTKEAQRHYAYYSGWMDTINCWDYLWKYIKECSYDGVIHKMN